MTIVFGWIALVLMAYVIAAIFVLSHDVKVVLGIASASSEFQSEAMEVLKKNHRARFMWVKHNWTRLPQEAHLFAKRAVAIDLSCWLTLLLTFILYALQFIAP